MSFSTFLKISEEERTLLVQSIDNLSGKLNEMVELFYYYFLNSNQEVKMLFQNANMDKQHNMFNVSIGVIVTNIQNPNLMEDHLNDSINKHKLYGVKADHIQYFSQAYGNAISEVFGEDDPLMKAWLKLIYSVMEYFKSKL